MHGVVFTVCFLIYPHSFSDIYRYVFDSMKLCALKACVADQGFFYSYIETAMEESLMMLQEGAINTSIVTL